MESIISELFGADGLSGILLPPFQITDVLDILAVAFLIYEAIIWIRKTRGWMLFKGIAIVLAVWLVAAVLKLNMVIWIFERVFSIGVLAIIIIFQPELRRALEKLGTSTFVTNLFGYKDNTVNKKTAEAMAEAMEAMAETKTGALIAIEQMVALGEYEQTGIPIGAEISSQLLINMFVKNTPLHDGAVIIRQNRILAATCYLPLSESNTISKELGTRHRAALGLSEVSDAKVFIVSEETGAMSMAFSGQIYRNIDRAFIEKQLLGDGPESKHKEAKTHTRLPHRAKKRAKQGKERS